MRHFCWCRPQRRNRIPDPMRGKAPLVWSSYGLPRLCPDCSVFPRYLRTVSLASNVHGGPRHLPGCAAHPGEDSSSGFGPSLPRSRRESSRMTAASVTSRPNSRRRSAGVCSGGIGFHRTSGGECGRGSGFWEGFHPRSASMFAASSISGRDFHPSGNNCWSNPSAA